MRHYQYRHYSQRGPFNVIRKAGGRGRPALIEWLSIHPKYRAIIIEKYGDPEKLTALNSLDEYLITDTKAKTFFHEYMCESGKRLNESTIAEYSVNASICNAVIDYVADRKTRRRKLGKTRTQDIWEDASRLVDELDTKRWPHSLPGSMGRLKNQVKDYRKTGYKALIHGNIGNDNAEKINDEAKGWVIARWALPFNRVPSLARLKELYNEKAEKEGWKRLKQEKTLYNFLYRSDVKSMWYGARHGELKEKKRTAYQHSTIRPQKRDSLWYGDGTKLNLFYQEGGKVKTCQVYVVMDAYSEVFLGYCISESEDYASQYAAYKMAIQRAGHKPYQLIVDNQGGHKKLETGKFLSKICHVLTYSQPYNPQGKAIESALGRFQKQRLSTYWFFTGQNITAKRVESHANKEFINANSGNLPTLAEIKQTYGKEHEKWNHAKHFATGIPRIQMYEESVNEKAPAVSIWDMVDLFWVHRQNSTTIAPYGIQFTEKKETYTYMVYKSDGQPDMEWLNDHVEKKVHIKYDPKDMSLIYLYEDTPKGLVFIREATAKIGVHRALCEHEEYEMQYIRQIQAGVNAHRIAKRDDIEEIWNQYDMLPDNLTTPGIAGIEGNKKTKKQGRGKKDKPVKPISMAEEMKQISNLAELEEKPLDLYSRY